MMPCHVSILIPCYNAERWIAQAIESALAQTWPDIEVIVADDGSTDGSLGVIERFGKRIRWESGPNRGGNAARNRLLELARGEWLQYLDADDYLLPHKIERQVSFLKEHPCADIVLSRVIQETQSVSGVHQDVTRLPDTHDPWILLVRCDLSQTGAALWRKQALVTVGGWNVNQRCCQEYELYLRLLIAGQQFAYCSDYGAVYRQWSGGSVCTREPQEVHRGRLEIIQQAEDFLRDRSELSSQRLWAINHARLELARRAWQYDPTLATEIVMTIRQSQPRFVPGGPGARIDYPLAYRLSYRLLGFQGAETIADHARDLLPFRQK